MDENKPTIIGYFELIKIFVSENKLKFIIFSLYFFGITKDFFYYQYYNINIFEYSTLYDFIISPFSDFLLLFLILTLLGIVLKRETGIQRDAEFISKVKKELNENIKYGFITIVVIIAMISMTAIFKILINFNWITIVPMIFLGILFYFLGVSIHDKDNKRITFFYLTIFAFYCIANPLLQNLYMNTERVVKVNVYDFKYEDRWYRDYDGYIIGTNSKYIFSNRKRNQIIIVPKDDVKNLIYSY